jgi:SepF-like predicted cell division protein (DUF552 family)
LWHTPLKNSPNGLGACALLVAAVPPLESDPDLFEHVVTTIAMTVTSLIVQRLDQRRRCD